MWIEISLSNHDYRKKVDVAKREMKKIKEYAERGYTHAVALDLSKYFDTLNHEKLLNLLRRDIKDERVIQWIKRYLKSGVMENGVVMETEEGSPQGGNISPLLANIYLNEFDPRSMRNAELNLSDMQMISFFLQRVTEPQNDYLKQARNILKEH